MKAYLLAAGYATRMYPLTRDRPKPLLEVAGAPLLTHLLDSVRALSGLSEVIVIGNRRFAPHFAAWASGLGGETPVRVLDDGSTSDEDKLGAIGDLAFALERVPPGEEDWMVAAGDNLLAFDLARLQRRFMARGSTLLSLREVVREGPSKYNEVFVEEDGRVASFREKPPDPVSPLAAIALYFFPPEVAPLIPRYLGEGGNPDAPGHFIAWLVERVPVYGERLAGDWFDIGSIEGLEHARERFVPRPKPR